MKLQQVNNTASGQHQDSIRHSIRHSKFIRYTLINTLTLIQNTVNTHPNKVQMLLSFFYEKNKQALTGFVVGPVPVSSVPGNHHPGRGFHLTRLSND